MRLGCTHANYLIQQPLTRHSKSRVGQKETKRCNPCVDTTIEFKVRTRNIMTISSSGLLCFVSIWQIGWLASKRDLQVDMKRIISFLHFKRNARNYATQVRLYLSETKISEVCGCYQAIHGWKFEE